MTKPRKIKPIKEAANDPVKAAEVPVQEIQKPPSIEMGDLVREVASGFDGIVVGISVYLFGDSHVLLQKHIVGREEYKEPIWVSGKGVRLLTKNYAAKVMG